MINNYNLKLGGILKGDEINVAGKYYMQGDKILINKTDKNLGVTNGDIARIIKASENKFTIELAKKEMNADKEYHNQEKTRQISFNPSEFDGFTHGYATTIFGAQGVSSKAVYFFHNGFAGLKNAYVALSRMVENVKLYINAKATYSDNFNRNTHLIKQLSTDTEKSVSLNYLTKSEYDKVDIDREYEKNKTLFSRAIVATLEYTAKKVEQFTDKYIPKSEYYNYQEPKYQKVKVSEVVDEAVASREIQTISHLKVAGGGTIKAIGTSDKLFDNVINNSNINHSGVKLESKNNYKNTSNTTSNKLTPKQKFYNNFSKAKDSKLREEAYDRFKEEYAKDTDRMRYEASFRSDQIAINLLGHPNKKLSNHRELRFGEHGKLVVSTSGKKRGLWHDFSEDKGGDMFDLVTHVKGGDCELPNG